MLRRDLGTLPIIYMNYSMVFEVGTWRRSRLFTFAKMLSSWLGQRGRGAKV